MPGQSIVIASKRNGVTLLIAGAVILYLTAVYFPTLYRTTPHAAALTWIVLLPMGLSLFVLGIYRLLMLAVQAVRDEAKRRKGN